MRQGRTLARRRTAALLAVGIGLALALYPWPSGAATSVPGISAAGTPATGTPATGTPATGTPATGTSVTGGAGAQTPPPNGTPTPNGGAPAPGAVTPGPTAPASGGHGITRPERAVLLVTLTFIVGVGLLGAPDPRDPGADEPRRPRLGLHDDPASTLRPDSRPARPAGAPPPLR